MSSKKTGSKNTRADSSALPLLPESVIEHHLKIFARPMQEWFNSKKIPPVLLLTGLPGIGKRGFAHFLARWLVCEQQTFAPHPCGHCSSCQKILSGNSVDVTEIAASEEETQKGPSLKTELFRQLKASMGFSGGSGPSGKKIILIPDANRMTTQAANAMLKVLEEPPRGWIFILTTHDSSVLLPTLTSRCQKMRLNPFSKKHIEDLLKNLNEACPDPEQAEICAYLAQGSWERARSLAENDVWEKRKAVLEFFEEPARVTHSLVDWASQDSFHFTLLLDLFEQLLVDLIRWSAETQADSRHPEQFSWPQKDTQKILANHAQKMLQKLGGQTAARNFWLLRAERIAQMRQEALAPLNKKLLVQDLLIPWLEPQLGASA